MEQTTLEVPDVPFVPPWQEAAGRSTIPRIPWKKLLGKSLNQIIPAQLAMGFRAKEIEKNIMLMLSPFQHLLEEKGWTQEKIAENLKIGVSARIAEMTSEKTAYKLKKAQALTWRAQVIRTKAGSRIIGIAKEIEIEDGTLVEVQIRPVEK